MSQNKPGAIIIEGHVQGLSNTRSLGEAGIPVYVVDKTNCIARYSKYCIKFFHCPDFIKDDFAEFLIKLAKSEEINNWVLIPSNDHAVYTISKHKTKLEYYYKVITPGLDIIEKIYDKSKLIKIAQRANVPVPTTQFLYSEEVYLKENLKYPVIIKGRNGLSFYKAIGKKVLIANNGEDLQEKIEFIRKSSSVDATFIQELIPFNASNYTISFTAFCVKGNINAHWSGVKLREHPFRFGTATYTKSIDNPACYQQSIPLLKELNYTGVCEVEYIQDPRDGEYKLIEINPRTWLWVGLAKACGVNYAKYIYDYFHGEICFAESADCSKMWINIFTDFVFSLKSLFTGDIKIRQYINSYKGEMVRAVYYSKDKKPSFMYGIFLLKFLRMR